MLNPDIWIYLALTALPNSYLHLLTSSTRTWMVFIIVCCRSKYILMISPLPHRPHDIQIIHTAFSNFFCIVGTFGAPRPVSQLVAPPSLVRHSLARCLQTASGWGALVALEVEASGWILQGKTIELVSVKYIIWHIYSIYMIYVNIVYTQCI